MAEPLQVWIVDDDQSVRWVLEKALRAAGMVTRSFERVRELQQALKDALPDVLVTDVQMPGVDGLTLLKHLTETLPDLPVIVITAYSDLDNAVAAYVGGAFEYLPKPFDVDEVVALVRKAARHQSGDGNTKSIADSTMPSLIGQAPAMQEVFRSIGRLAKSSMTVLITGESGTGKELVARALHEHSPHRQKPFVALNTAAIAAELLESELFGHEKGAFTGADARRIGRFEQADGGTLFLDEIGDMSPALQTRLLRVLAESEFFRVGGQSTISVDVRVIAATNQDLGRAVRENRFREDLFHRLNVMKINTPPLRDRRDDIPELFEHYLDDAGKEFGATGKSISPEAMAQLKSYDWPGNVRQLVNVARRLTATAPGHVITQVDIPRDLNGRLERAAESNGWSTQLGSWAERELAANEAGPLLQKALPEFERTLIDVALKAANGHRQTAAKLLGWGRNTLTRKIQALEREE